MIRGRLALQPRSQVTQALFQTDGGLPSENLASCRNVGEAMPDVSGPVAAGDFGFHSVSPQSSDTAIRDFTDCHRIAARNVNGYAIRPVSFQCKPKRASHIVNAHEIPHLLAVFVNQRGL